MQHRKREESFWLRPLRFGCVGTPITSTMAKLQRKLTGESFHRISLTCFVNPWSSFCVVQLRLSRNRYSASMIDKRSCTMNEVKLHPFNSRPSRPPALVMKENVLSIITIANNFFVELMNLFAKLSELRKQTLSMRGVNSSPCDDRDYWIDRNLNCGVKSQAWHDVHDTETLIIGLLTKTIRSCKHSTWTSESNFQIDSAICS